MPQFSSVSELIQMNWLAEKAWSRIESLSFPEI